MTAPDVALALFSGLVGATFGAIGGAFGATRALRSEFTAHKTDTDTRLTLVETRVGVTKDGALTGNGIIGTMRQLAQRIDIRNHDQHPDEATD